MTAPAAPQVRPFGRLPDGRPVEQVSLEAGPLRAEVLTWGAVVRDLRFRGHAPPLVLGLQTLADYLAHSPSFGASVGRCANRIAGGRYRQDGAPVQLERNEAGGRNHLHGGSHGMGKSLWRIESVAPARLVLSIRDPAGNAGYPGTVETRLTLSLDEPGTLALRYESRTDAPTPVNISHHGYFNLDGAADIRAHRVRIAADAYLPLDAAKIPLGPPQPVAGTPFDLRQETGLGARLAQLAGGFDHNFCLSPARKPLRPVARVSAPGGMAMEVATTEPGLQFYTAAALDCPAPGLEGRHYGPAAGLCLEAQIWPDAINHPDYPPVLLRPGELRTQQVEYRFRPSVALHGAAGESGS